MNRAAFLRRVGVVVGALAVGKLPSSPTPPAKETLELGVMRDSKLVAVNDYRVFAESFGGLCAPISPYYALTPASKPVRDALPRFNARRG